MRPCVIDRKKKIIDIIKECGRVNVNELTRMFDVSDATIRVNLADLERQGVLERVYGGAVFSHKPYCKMSLQNSDVNQAEKRAIAEKAADLVADNETVILNAGATALYAFDALQKRKKLNIMTNSIEVAIAAANRPDFRVMLLGGSVNAKDRFTYGGDALKQLSAYHADKLIMSVDGVSCGGGISTYYQQTAELSRRMLKHADVKIVMADFMKMGKAAFVKVSDVSAVDLIITNKDAPESEIELFENRGFKLMLV